MKRFALAALALMLTTGVSLAQTKDVAAPAAKTERVDPRDAAKERFAAWKQSKLECYRATGAVEGKHWRVNPDNPGDIQTHSSMWDLPDAVQKKVAGCKAMSRQ